MKERADLISENYLNIKQTARLLNISIPTARALYAKADGIDSQMEFRVEEKKVRMSSILKVAGLSYDEIKKRAAMRPPVDNSPKLSTSILSERK